MVGLRPRAGNRVEVNPLLPAGTWDWFCLEDVRYHAQLLTVVWDRDGRRFGRGAGLRLYAVGRQIAHATGPRRITGKPS